MTADGNADLTYTWTEDTLDTTTYATSENGTEITNQLSCADPNLYEGVEETVTWLSRSDWNGTLPTETVKLTLTELLKKDLQDIRYDAADYESVEMPTLGAIGQRWLIGRIISPGPMPDYTTDRDAFFAMWQNSQLEIDLYDPATRACEKLFETPCCDGEKWMYSGQRDGVPYFIHYTATEDQSYTMAVGLDKLENGTMTTVYTPQSDQWPEFESYGQDGENRWVVEYLRDSIAIYDLADGQTYTPTVDHDNYIGYPIQLLPDDRVVVTNGWYETTAATDRQPALVTIDMTAYLNGSTDYTPIEMYTGK